MAVGADFPVAVVLINRHEPEGGVARRLMELADEKGYDARTVEAQRGEHDVALSFRVPRDVADVFNAERGDRWPVDTKIENDDEKAVDQAADADQTSTPDRKARTGKARE